MTSQGDPGAGESGSDLRKSPADSAVEMDGRARRLKQSAVCFFIFGRNRALVLAAEAEEGILEFQSKKTAQELI